MSPVLILVSLMQMLTAMCGQYVVPSQFYPFGPEEGDWILPPNDDNSSNLVFIGTSFPFFNKAHSSLYVNNNGGISFDYAISDYTPDPFPLDNTYTFIAVFWADVDTSYGQGSVLYREVTDSNLLDQLTSDVVEVYGSQGLSFFKAEWAFIATWYQVGAYGGLEIDFGHNTFQLAIITDGTYSFAIFNYEEISWTYGTASEFIHAQVGFNAGDGVHYFATPDSRTSEIINIPYTSNVGTTGRWMFRIDQATITDGGCLFNREGNCDPHQIETSPGICEDIAPALGDCPLLSDPDLVDGLYVYFYCDVILTHSATAGTVFEVDFLFDGEKDSSIPSTVLRASDTRAKLHEKYLHGNLGKRVSCQVVSYFERTPEQRSSPLVSNSYFAGVKSSVSYLRVTEGGSTSSVHLKSTLPVSCMSVLPGGGLSSCKTSFNIDSSDNLVVYQPGREYEEDFTCQYRLDSSDWKPDERAAYSDLHPLYILPVISLTKDPPSTETVRFQGVKFFDKMDEDGNRYPPMWNDYTLDLIVYRYDNEAQGATCYSTGDPRLTTFDKLYYDIYAAGQFVMVKSSSPRGFEVHVRHESCTVAPAVACICGLAVQEGTEAILLEMCKKKPLQKGHRTTNSHSKLSEGMLLKTNSLGDTYTIETPSGAFAKVYVNDWGMSVTLHIPGQDFEKTEGLCGTFDNNENNDLNLPDSRSAAFDSQAVNTFVESWRIPEGQSLFERSPIYTPPNDDPGSSEYCKCELQALEELVPCGTLTDKQTYPELTRHDVVVPTGSIVNSLIVGIRKKRDTNTGFMNYDYDPSDFDHAIDSKNNLEFSWPTVTGITEEEAQDYCRRGILESEVYKACQDHVDNVEDTLAKCIADVKVSSIFANWAEDHLDEVLDGCRLHAFQSYTGSSDNATESRLLAVGFLSGILQDVCPNQCSGNGHCSDSTCTCDEGFEGEDCSVDAASLPNALAVVSADLCDSSQRQCTSAVLMVENIVYSETLTCKLEVMSSGSITKQRAQFEGFRQVRCEIPEMEDNHIIYRISVSKNGADFGSHQEMVVYDGSCMQCDSSGCTVKENSCSIDGLCYYNGASSSSDSCHTCNPTQAQTTWSTKDVPECKSERKTWIIVLAVLLPVVLLVLIILSVCLIKKIIKRKKLSCTVPTLPEVYASNARPQTAASMATGAKSEDHQISDEKKAFDCSHILTPGESQPAQPPVNHFLADSYFAKTQK